LKNKSNIISYILILIFAVIPLVAGIGYALLYSFGLVGALNNGFTLQHWKLAFADQAVINSFLYSAAIAAVALSISVSLAIAAALRYYHLFKKGLLAYLIYLPLAFPAMVAAFFFFQFLSKGGLLSRIFYQTGLTSSMQQFPDWVNDKYGIGMIITHLFLSFPFFLLLFVSLIETQRLKDFFQLSASLGASKRQTTFRVAVPLLLQKSFPNIILYFIFIFGAYEIPVLLGRSNPEMVSVLAVRKLQKFNLQDIPQGYVIAIVYTLFVLVFILLLLKQKKLAYAN
jgi:putative spermidine/putrescine transport system permease protein